MPRPLSWLLVLPLLGACGQEPTAPQAVPTPLDARLAAAAEQALGLGDRGRLEPLGEQLEAHLARHPQDQDARRLAGRVAHALVDHAGALEHLRGVSLADPELLVLRATLVLDAGEPELAYADLQAAAAAGEDGPELHYQRGRLAEEQGELGEAQAAYVRSLERAPARPQVHFGLARVLRDQGQDAVADQAMGEFQRWTGVHHQAEAAAKAARAAPEDGALAVAAARAWFAAGEFEPAAAWARRGQGLDDSLHEAVLVQALVEQATGRTADAAARLDALLLRAPDYAEARRERAWVHLAQGNPEAALTAMEQARTAAPQDARGVHEQGLLLLELGQPAQALAAFDAALSLDGSLLDAHLGAAQVRYGRGELDAARAHWERVLELAPGHPGAVQSLAVLEGQR